MAAQQELLGVSLDAHPLELVAEKIAAAGAITTVEAAGRIGQRVTVAGVRQSGHRSRTARGEPMMFLTLEEPGRDAGCSAIPGRLPPSADFHPLFRAAVCYRHGGDGHVQGRAAAAGGEGEADGIEANTTPRRNRLGWRSARAAGARCQVRNSAISRRGQSRRLPWCIPPAFFRQFPLSGWVCCRVR